MDADACPVKDIIISEARTFSVPVVLVMSFSHFSNLDNEPGVETIYVDAGADAADYRIMQLSKKEDFIITQDYGLASLGLGKGCRVLHHKGFEYSHQNIDQLLTTRHANAKARRSGYKTKGPKAFTNQDRETFRTLLHNVLSNA